MRKVTKVHQQGKNGPSARASTEERAPKATHRRYKNDYGRHAAFGLSKKARKTYLKMVQKVQLTSVILKMARIDNPIIKFSEEDAQRLHHPHNDALVVSIRVGE